MRFEGVMGRRRCLLKREDGTEDDRGIGTCCAVSNAMVVLVATSRICSEPAGRIAFQNHHA
jgi:hypothetical protein